MLRYYGIIRESAHKVAEAIDHTVEGYVDGRIEQEPAFTDRMLGSIEETLSGFQVKGVTWQAKTLSDRGRHAQEKKYGADFMGVLEVSLPEYNVRKGFLAQAKIIDSWFIDFRELHSQCERMLKLSPASFVFLYSKKGVTVVPAISVVATSANPTELYSRNAARFFEEHFESFIGDRNIAVPKIEALDELRGRYEARSLLYLAAGTT